MRAPARLDDGIDYIDAQHPAGNSLARLSDAVLVSQRLGEVADQLIGRYVDQARRSGATLSTIGQAMGVTEQAAQKRFAADLPGLGLETCRWTGTARARSTIAAESTEAAVMSRTQPGLSTAAGCSVSRLRSRSGAAFTLRSDSATTT